MKASLLLAFLLFTTLANCESQKGCEANPCKTGKCVEDSKNPADFTCECSRGMAGKKCDTVDLCATKNPCKKNEICSLDKDLKPVCNCPPGYDGKDCKSRLCEIVEFKGNNTNGKVYISNNLVGKLEAVDQLAKECKVFVDVIKSFTRLAEPEEAVPANETSIFIGEGVMFRLNDLKGKVICEKDCLKKHTTNDGVKCFFNGLNKTGLTQAADNPEILENSAKQTSDEYKKNKLIKQVGCQLVDTYPSLLKPSKLVGNWELADSKNWEDFLIENDVGWWKRLALKAIKPDMHITNDGKTWTIHIISTFKSMKTTFTEGVEFESLSPISGSKTKHMIVTEGRDKLVEDQVIYKSKPVKLQVIREIVGDKLIQTMKLNKVVCVRTYRRKQ